MYKQIFTILLYYLKKADISFSKTRLKQLFYSHPENESLYAIADVLQEMDIENVALRLDFESLQANGFPAMVHTIENGGTFMVIDEIQEDNVVCYKAKDGKTIQSLDNFISTWSGIAFYVAQNGTVNEKDTLNENLIKWRAILAIATGAVCFALWSFTVTWTTVFILLYIICIFGLAVSTLLTMHTFGESNRFIHKVCHLNRLTNCNAVLYSSASKLFGWLSMSDIGLCYFSGCIFSLMLASATQQTDTVISWLLALGICTFPYTIFSLSYQAFSVKKWCPMCLAVVGILWSKIAIALLIWSELSFVPANTTLIFIFMASFAVPIFAWSFIKPLWNEYNRTHDFEYRYLRLRRDTNVIRAMLTKETAREMDFIKDEIHLGRINAPIHITAAISFSCNMCANNWKLLSRWLLQHPEKLWITIRFFGYNMLHADNKKVYDTLACIYEQYGAEKFCKATTAWYEIKDDVKWKKIYLPTAEDVSEHWLSKKNAKWEREQSLTYTPVIFVDDRIYPFELSDLENLLKEL